MTGDAIDVRKSRCDAGLLPTAEGLLGGRLQLRILAAQVVETTAANKAILQPGDDLLHCRNDARGGERLGPTVKETAGDGLQLI